MGLPEITADMRRAGVTPAHFDLSYKEVSAISGLSERYLRRLVANGELAAVKHGRAGSNTAVRIPLAEWERYRNARLTKAA